MNIKTFVYFMAGMVIGYLIFSPDHSRYVGSYIPSANNPYPDYYAPYTRRW